MTEELQNKLNMESLTDTMGMTSINEQDDDEHYDHAKGMESLMRTLHFVNTLQFDRIGERTKGEWTQEEWDEWNKANPFVDEWTKEEWDEWTKEWDEWNEANPFVDECDETKSYEGPAYRDEMEELD